MIVSSFRSVRFPDRRPALSVQPCDKRNAAGPQAELAGAAAGAYFVGQNTAMDFGRLDSVDGLQFELPPSPPPSPALLGQLRGVAGGTQIYIGAPAWGSAGFVGRLYPRGSKPREFLKHYSRQFGTVELNTTFYRLPDAPTLARWVADTPEHFRFCPKFPRNLDLGAPTGSRDGLLAEFLQVAEALGARMGHAFLQLPRHCDAGYLDRLRSTLDALPEGLPCSVEFRHASWFDDADFRSRLFDELTDRGIGAVITDTAGRRDVLHMQPACPEVLVRFAGNLLHPSDYRRLDDWAARIAAWCAYPLRAVYFMIHQPEEHLVTGLAVHLARAIAAHTGIAPRHPVPAETGDRQGSLFG
jgi:uncharacterized protein YecE (DUF72 family)